MVNSCVNHQAAARLNGCQLCKPVTPSAQLSAIGVAWARAMSPSVMPVEVFRPYPAKWHPTMLLGRNRLR